MDSTTYTLTPEELMQITGWPWCGDGPIVVVHHDGVVTGNDGGVGVEVGTLDAEQLHTVQQKHAR